MRYLLLMLLVLGCSSPTEPYDPGGPMWCEEESARADSCSPFRIPGPEIASLLGRVYSAYCDGTVVYTSKLAMPLYKDGPNEYHWLVQLPESETISVYWNPDTVAAYGCVSNDGSCVPLGEIVGELAGIVTAQTNFEKCITPVESVRILGRYIQPGTGYEVQFIWNRGAVDPPSLDEMRAMAHEQYIQ